MKSSEKHYKEFQERFLNLSDERLIMTFNKEVGNKGWGTARAAFLSALHSEFIRREFDFSAIGNKRSLSFRNKIKLTNKVVVII
jgi:hypothetical protein